jgi:hypothetical protein
VSTYEQRNSPPVSLPINILRDEAAYLLNVLVDNARPWNGRLRKELQNFVTGTDAHNAKMILQGRMTASGLDGPDPKRPTVDENGPVKA